MLSRQRHIARRSVRQQGSAERPARRVGDIVRSPEAVERARIRLARRHDIVRSELAVAVGLGLGRRARNAQIARVGRCWRSSRRRRRPRRDISRWWWRPRWMSRRRGRRARNGCFFRFLPVSRRSCDVVSSRGAQQFACFLVGRGRWLPAAAARRSRGRRRGPRGAAAVGAARPRSGPCRPSGRWRSSRASSWPSLACAASMTSSARRHCSLAASGGALMGTGQPRRARQLCEGSAGACHNGEMRNAGLIFPSPRGRSVTRAFDHRVSAKPLTTPAAETREMISQRRRALHTAARAAPGCL